MTQRTGTGEATTQVAVIGAGIAGLATAGFLARRGYAVTVYERASTPGGRAATHTHDGYRMNLGPHALYREGEGSRVLGELGVRFSGGVPAAAGGFALDSGRAHTLPGGFLSLVTTSLFGAAGKVEAARFLAGFPRIDAASLQRTSVAEFVSRTVHQPAVRRLIEALFRLSTYANDPARMSAGTAVAQLQLALKSGVIYLDGGWQTLVDGLRREAEAQGVRVVTGAGVAAVEHDGPDGGLRALRLRDGRRVPVAAAVVAAGPDVAHELLREQPSATLAAAARDAIRVRAACLDVALSALPRPAARFALGIDQPLYFSVHSAVARLAPDGGALVHVAKYLPSDADGTAKADERELEGVLDQVQPGWRSALVERRFLPEMTVAHALPTAAAGGTTGRPGPQVPDVAGLFVAGDWVGPDGLLADASLASARRAATLATEHLAREAAAA